MKLLLVGSFLIFTSTFSFSQAKWNCGVNGAANVVAVFEAATQTLIVSGKGKMGDGAPWANLREAIKIVKIGEGVTSIGEEAFGSGWFTKQFYPNLETVIISNTVTEIGQMAFSGAANLRKVNIPSGITKIGGHAFAYCGLESISLPASTKQIGPYVFLDCKSLKTADIRNVPVILSYIDFFRGCESLEEVFLPKNIESITDEAFYNCHSLKSITCYNPTPPKIAFDSRRLGAETVIDVSKITLYVPEASIVVYKYSDGWKNFGEIKAIPAR